MLAQSSGEFSEHHAELREVRDLRDIEKLNMAHEENSRRTRRRRRGRSVYALLVVVLAFVVIVLLSTTVFFNIRTIRVTGNAEQYDVTEIINAVGVSQGDNMMRLHLDELEQKAEETLIEAEHVDIKRQFPDTLVIDVVKSVPAFNVSYEYGTLIVSKGGKILRNSMDPMEGLISISGYEPAETAPGRRLSAIEERYDRIFHSFEELIDSGELQTPITSVNMSDLNNIVVNFDDRIEFFMGNWSEINYKINFAEEVIARQPAGKQGILTMIGNNQCSFRNQADVLNAEKRFAERTAETTETTGTTEETSELPAE